MALKKNTLSKRFGANEDGFHPIQLRMAEARNKVLAEIKTLVDKGLWIEGSGCSRTLTIIARSRGCAPAVEKALKAAYDKLGFQPDDWCVMSSVLPRKYGNGDQPAPLELIDPELLRLAVATLEPEVVVCLDEPSAALVRLAYAEEFELQQPCQSPLRNPCTLGENASANPNTTSRSAAPSALNTTAIPTNTPATNAAINNTPNTSEQILLNAPDNYNKDAFPALSIASVLGMRILNLSGFSDSLPYPQQKQQMWYMLKQIAPWGAPY